MPEKTLLVITGPTCVGKTQVALEVAERLGVPVVSADSRQIYRRMPICTAAPTPSELRRVRHYFVGELEPTEYYSAARYEEAALSVIEDQLAGGDVALMVGGSMLYIDAALRGLDSLPRVSAETREKLRLRLQSQGLEALVAELSRLDPEYALRVDRRNPRRVLHALELCYESGGPASRLLRGRQARRPWRTVKVALQRERQDLFERISSRVDQMVSQGLEEEARALWPLREAPGVQTVGLRELFAYFDGTYTRAQAIEKIKRNTRVYAKKQMTWLAHDADIHWMQAEEATAERIISLL